MLLNSDYPPDITSDPSCSYMVARIYPFLHVNYLPRHYWSKSELANAFETVSFVICFCMQFVSLKLLVQLRPNYVALCHCYIEHYSLYD